LIQAVVPSVVWVQAQLGLPAEQAADEPLQGHVQMPLVQVPEQQSLFPLQALPLAVHGVTHMPLWQIWPLGQQSAVE
jgi:hypothetical protein